MWLEETQAKIAELTARIDKLGEAIAVILWHAKRITGPQKTITRARRTKP